MNDPYKVLGVSPNASNDEVKRAYRELVKKYHPDNYVNNPLADLAEEKMKEINEAYDAIMKGRAGGNGNSSGGSSYSGGSYSHGGGAGSRYQNIRRAIAEGNLALAESLLASAAARDAEWNFLMGTVMYQKGWYDNARTYFTRAYSMEPNNPEYAEAMSRKRYGQSGGAYNGMNGACLSPCDCCTMLMCADCMCPSELCC